MSTTASHSRASRATRAWVALAIAGWLAISGLTLLVDVPSDRADSPEMQIQATPVKAYPG